MFNNYFEVHIARRKKMAESFDLFFSFLLLCYSISNLLVFYEVFYSIHRRLLILEKHHQQPLGCRVQEERPGGVHEHPPAYQSAPNRFLFFKSFLVLSSDSNCDKDGVGTNFVYYET